MTSLLLCAMVLVFQAPQRGVRTPAQRPAKHDTIYVAIPGPPPTVNVQTPAPSVTVESPSDVPTIVLGILGAILLAFQLGIMGRQTRLMSRQTDAMKAQGELMAKQTALGEQQARWQRDETIGTFYRIAHDLADELQKANVMATTVIPANFETHPRQMLREAAKLFAPLGNDVVFAATGAAMYVERYFSAVLAYNTASGGSDGAASWYSIQQLREQVGRNLDETNVRIPADLRWKYSDSTDYSFRKLCSMPLDLAKAIGGPTLEGREGES
jgi:hypothetical protein